MKIKPKDKMGFFKKNKRYLMFTNRKLYTMDPKTFEDGKIDREKLIVNEIDIQYLSHLIFFPDFVFDTYEYLDIKKLSQLNPNIIQEFESKKIEIILGFSSYGYGGGKVEFGEADIALATNMHVLLQLIHCC